MGIDEEWGEHRGGYRGGVEGWKASGCKLRIYTVRPQVADVLS